ncbi:MAG: sigma-54 interaction domain-containing protein [Desulfobaccales bacterium]
MLLTHDAKIDLLFQNILDSIAEAAIIVDKKGSILFANKNYANVVGVSGNMVVGKSLPEIEPSAFLNRVILTGETLIGNNKLERIKLDIHTNAYPIFSKNRVVGGVGIFCKALESKYPARDAYIQKFNLVGETTIFKEMVAKAIKVSLCDSSILITGESGAGKGDLAKFIHNASPRRNGAFVAINCAAIPDNLLESELFGYTTGAFTGARPEGKKGKLVLADGGTLFLDEIGDMSTQTQAKLLMAIQDKEIEPIGGIKKVPLNIRIIAASNKDLMAMIKNKTFREDLYYRLNVIPINVPSLREREGDLPILINYFILKHCNAFNKMIVMPEELSQKLALYHWPGNIRELSNVLEYAVVMGSGAEITAKHLPEYLHRYLESGISPPSKGHNLSKIIKDVEYKTIIRVLGETGGNRTEAINILGVSRKTFYDRLKKYNLS